MENGLPNKNFNFAAYIAAHKQQFLSPVPPQAEEKIYYNLLQTIIIVGKNNEN